MNNEDLQHLKILSIFHYVVAGVAGLFACFPIIHLSVGLSMVFGSLFSNEMNSNEVFPMTLFGMMFTVIPAAMILLGWAFAACVAAAGYFLSKYQRYMFCLVVAGVSCIFTPFGTVLGIFTILVLMRPSVKELFEKNSVT